MFEIDRITILAKEKGVSFSAICRELGLNVGFLNNVKNGKATLSENRLEQIADFLGTTVEYLQGKTDKKNKPTYSELDVLPNMINIPLVGSIACGTPITAVENIDDYISVPAYCGANFALSCKGNSMKEARILDGDIVLIRQQPDVENGEIAAVLVGEEATLKKVIKKDDEIILMAANSNYEPMFYTGEQMSKIQILGKAVYFISKII